MTTSWQRIRQFFAHLSARMTDRDHALVVQYLNPAERELFYGMHIADQRHSVEVTRTLLGCGKPVSRHLLKLALLHDIGKQRVHFSLWERVLVVLWPRPSLDVPDEPLLGGIRRAWQIKRWHPEYGARLLADLPDGDPDLAELIRQTQAHPPPSTELELFHWADDQN